MPRVEQTTAGNNAQEGKSRTSYDPRRNQVTYETIYHTSAQEKKRLSLGADTINGRIHYHDEEYFSLNNPRLSVWVGVASHGTLGVRVRPLGKNQEVWIRVGSSIQEPAWVMSNDLFKANDVNKGYDQVIFESDPYLGSPYTVDILIKEKRNGIERWATYELSATVRGRVDNWTVEFTCTPIGIQERAR
jgi:hypothetical protein